MNAVLGSGAVAMGFAASVLAAVSIGGGLVTGRPSLVRRSGAYAGIALATAIVAFAVMERAIITRDFELAYVAQVGSTRTPALYNFTALWSSLEGSILLWALILTAYVAIVAHKFRRRLADPLVGWAMLTLFVVTAFFFALMLGPANPFRTLADPPLDGPGPNPLLQNHPLVAFHPPMLYLGYVGFTVPFAFAVAALVTGRLGEGWLLATRRWTLFAWGFLTAGILLGAWWSYEVLGWGGYWGWDPVENASLLPWLTGTAYLHSVMVQERRGMLRVWNLSLVCATFALTIFGTFLTRAGVLDSVHNFSDSGIGPWLLVAFAVVSAVTIGLIGWRGDQLRSPGRIDSPISREGAFLANNVLFAAFGFVVLLGTVAPLLVEAINDEQISVGAPYFEEMTRPIGFVLLFLMAIAPVLPWRAASAEVLSRRLFWPAWIGAAAMLVSLLAGGRGWEPVLAFGLGGFAGGAALRQVVLASRRQGWRGVVGRTNGGMVVHLGVVLVAVAMAASQSYVRQANFELAEGQSASFAGHTLTYVGSDVVEYPERTAERALIEVDGTLRAPAISDYPSIGSGISTPSVRTSWRDDVYLTLLIPASQNDGVAVVQATVQPLIVWLWIGGGVMAAGTVLAAFPGRRRVPTDPVSAPLPGAPPGPDPVPDESHDEAVLVR